MAKGQQKVLQTVNWPVFIMSGGFLLLFVVMAFTNMELTSFIVDKGFQLAITYFGGYWQVLLLATFLVGAVLAFSKLGSVRIGKLDKPEMGFFKYLAIVVTTGLGAGGVFWAAAEPLYYFLEAPPTYSGVIETTNDAIQVALAQSFISWGFSAWAVYGAICSIVMVYAHNHKGMPLKPRTILYPILGDRIQDSKWGTAVDVFCIIGAAAGTIGPIGFLGLQVSYGVNALFGWPDTYVTQVTIILILTSIVLLSTLTGIEKGIQWLSKVNVNTALFIGVFLVLFGPGIFLIDSYLSATGTYLSHFIEMSTFRGDNEWSGAWMLFFFGWFIGFGPIVALMVARISRGRTIRELFLVVAIITPILTNIWFTILGGSGIFYEIQKPGSIATPLEENGLPAAIIAIASQMPLGSMMPFLFLLLTILFVVTTVDTMSYSLAMSVTGKGNPAKSIRFFWASIMSIIAMILINVGNGGVNALQSFVVIAAVPVSLILLPLLWGAPKIALLLAKEQGIISSEEKNNK
ncbi:BCCT family transporter [Shouchella lehensis]|uniref:Glycine betaine transporter n=2 Tax=Shouchella lehensis TaxID=300825 RepID=A0A060M7J7_9BACI|nr:BCCT family transporter [Shouchella lehensis]AIC96044.1 Glycine betaine transporter [Shouchella lehensis G1]MBG9784982.1 BCCT transporter [Shouchella lehensis]TES46403.1 BCCT family transporter [Shouchella lehensis]